MFVTAFEIGVDRHLNGLQENGVEFRVDRRSIKPGLANVCLHRWD